MRVEGETPVPEPVMETEPSAASVEARTQAYSLTLDGTV